MQPEREFESLGDILGRSDFAGLVERIRQAGGASGGADAPPTAERCSRCLDAGLVRRDVPVGHPDFGRLVECPCGIVAERRRDRIWRSAQVPESMRGYTLDSFADLTGKHRLVADLRTWQQDGRRSLLLVGAVGLGKTGLAIALLLDAIRAGRSGQYVVAPSFLARIRATYGGAADGVDELAVLDSLIGTDVLVLDDLGKVRLSDWGQEKLYTVVNERVVAERPTIVTSNLDTEDGSIEAHLWPATWDRIRGSSLVIRLTGESLRGRRRVEG